MTYLSLFGSVGTEHGLDQDVSHERTTANHFNHTFLNTSSSAPTTAKPTSGLHIPTNTKRHGSPASSSSGTGSSKRKYSASPPEDLDPDSEEAQVAIKRQRNTMAARKYRQKRLDRISDLETALGHVTNERDELKLQLARREAEVEALREMLSKK
ncbi:Cross-pathway control protein 1 [Metarhizium anisopliae]|nr:Cross-pathway control protein 1 [Metarhizium anisopliae]